MTIMGLALAMEVCFTPGQRCEAVVANALNAAKESVYVQAYGFSNPTIAKAIVDAHRRGVRVAVILDRSNATARYSAATFLANAGIAPTIDSAHAIAHNKVMVIDAATVITGSYNFTTAAEKSNAENLLVIRDAELAQKYLANWQKHAAHAVTYQADRRDVSTHPENPQNRETP